jgi:hypothetical protein
MAAQRGLHPPHEREARPTALIRLRPVAIGGPALAPFAHLAGYDNDLRAMTRRRGAGTMAFDHYSEVPPRPFDDALPVAAAMRA